MRDIAESVGVSETAASFALNGRPGISEATRKKILDRVEEMGWRPSHAARTLSGAKSGTVGLVLPLRTASHGDAGETPADDSEVFFMRLMVGLQSVLGPAQLSLLMRMVETPDDELEVYRQWDGERRVDGVVLVDLRAEDARPALLDELGMPAILAGGPDPEARIPSVSIDDGAAMAAVLDHLQQQGLHRVAYLCGPPELVHVSRRIEAFTAARRGGRLTGEVVATDLTASAAERATVQLLEGPERPAAIICENEVVAVSVELALRSRGHHVPGDVAIVSCEDGPVCEAMRPPLTALHRDTARFGAEVARELLGIIGGQEPRSAEQRVPELIVRGSTAAPAD
ncbi:LacI family DNA-binding transcriptional regulator [Brachybacterium sp. GCM10030252]|uniref:LacI family DNA-binding transcriptional regulator n=1 Tax=Brachybacterium sp. GCM10030252 TaxID=3273380 RepID=UPI003620E43B